MNAFVKKDGSFAFRLLGTSDSGDFQLSKESGDILWSRDESLTETIGTVFVDLPESHLHSVENDELSKYSHFFSSSI